jgi:nucleoside-diphosphate-sugar epimerase
MIALLFSKLAGPINIASGHATSVAHVATRLAALLGRPELLQLGALPSQFEAPLVVADVRRLWHELGWVGRYNLAHGLAHTIDWWRHKSISQLSQTKAPAA